MNTGGGILIVGAMYFGYTFHDWPWWLIVLIILGLLSGEDAKSIVKIVRE